MQLYFFTIYDHMIPNLSIYRSIDRSIDLSFLCCNSYLFKCKCRQSSFGIRCSNIEDVNHLLFACQYVATICYIVVYNGNKLYWELFFNGMQKHNFLIQCCLSLHIRLISLKCFVDLKTNQKHII